jgi:predicted transcriptional regulator
MATTTPASVRLESALDDKVSAIAAALDRPRSWVIERAVRDCVAVQEWQLAVIDAGRVVDHDDVVAWVRSWGRPDELPMPECG